MPPSIAPRSNGLGMGTLKRYGVAAVRAGIVTALLAYVRLNLLVRLGPYPWFRLSPGVSLISLIVIFGIVFLASLSWKTWFLTLLVSLLISFAELGAVTYGSSIAIYFWIGFIFTALLASFLAASWAIQRDQRR